MNYVPITATIGLLDKAEGQESKLAHDSQPSCCDSVRFGRKIRPRRSPNATQMPPTHFESAFSLILGLARTLHMPRAAGGVISTANDLVTWMQALVGGRVFDADYHHRWLDSLQPEDPSKPHGQQCLVRHHPTAVRTEPIVFPRRRDAWLQLVHGLRSRQSGDARRVDQPARIARREADSQVSC